MDVRAVAPLGALFALLTFVLLAIAWRARRIALVYWFA